MKVVQEQRQDRPVNGLEVFMGSNNAEVRAK